MIAALAAAAVMGLLEGRPIWRLRPAERRCIWRTILARLAGESR